MPKPVLTPFQQAALDEMLQLSGERRLVLRAPNGAGRSTAMARLAASMDGPGLVVAKPPLQPHWIEQLGREGIAASILARRADFAAAPRTGASVASPTFVDGTPASEGAVASYAWVFAAVGTPVPVLERLNASARRLVLETDALRPPANAWIEAAKVVSFPLGGGPGDWVREAGGRATA